MKTSSENYFVKGLRDGVPVFLGYLAVSFAVGIAATGAGFGILQSGVMSLLNFTSTGEFSALELYKQNAPLYELAILEFIVNMRYILMSCALSQKLSPRIGTLQRLLVAHGVTDEIFGLSVLQKGELRPSYTYGLIVAGEIGWTGGTMIGAATGRVMPAMIAACLGLAIYGMFLAVIVPGARDSRPVLCVVLCAALMCTAFKVIPFLSAVSEGFRIIIVTVVISAAAAVLVPHVEEDLPEQAPEG